MLISGSWIKSKFSLMSLTSALIQHLAKRRLSTKLRPMNNERYSSTALVAPTSSISKTMPGQAQITNRESTVVSSAMASQETFPHSPVKDVLNYPERALNTMKDTPQSRSHATFPNMVDVSSAQVQGTKLLEKEEFDQFNAVFPQLVKFLTEIPELRDMPETNRWLARVLQYNVPHGKRNRGLATALAYRYLTDELDDNNVRLSYILGWTVEILQAFFLVADDIMDKSETRRGRPCWYKVENMDAAALNDSLLLEGVIYKILKEYFGDKDYYIDLVDTMHDATYKTTYGQSLDTRTGLGRQMETYTMDRYNGIVKYKTSYYSFHLPVALAMAMTGATDPELKRQVEKVTLEIGHFFQVQDDYLDCFGDTEITGKIGTDIQDCKCSWLFVVALEKATPVQRKILLANYGQDEESKIETVKDLYMEMGLPDLYHEFEESTFALITTHIQQMSPSLPKRLFNEMLAKIYHRSS